MNARPDAGAAEMVRVRPIDGRFAFVNLRCAGWSIAGIMVQRSDAGHRVTWPSTESGGEAFERQIAQAFDAALADRRARP